MLRSVALVALAGCSLVLVKGPPAHPPPPPHPIRCTTVPIVPVIDTLISAVTLAGALYFVQSDDENASLGFGIELALSAGFGISAYSGWRRVSRCRAVKDRPAPPPVSPAHAPPWPSQ